MSDLWHSVREIAGGGSPRLRIGARGIVELVQFSPTGDIAITAMDGRTVSVEYVDGVDLNVPGLVGQRVAWAAEGSSGRLCPSHSCTSRTSMAPINCARTPRALPISSARTSSNRGRCWSSATSTKVSAQAFLRCTGTATTSDVSLAGCTDEQSWDRVGRSIADEEAEEWPDPRDPQAVRATVNQWAKTLNVSLSPLPRGRPRTS